mmetsp:Transcript_14742/g.46320  ORF Transcript_14742/g.46320 Transcript_14742/m.46320 type:complete len:286 (-) Transcript_14742:173-1030(-)
MARRPPRQVPETPRPARDLPHQALLHLQHAHHPPDRTCLQSLLPLPAPLQPLPGRLPRRPRRQVAEGRRLRRRPGPRRRPRILHLPAPLPRRGRLRPLPRRLLPRLHPRLLRHLLHHVDRSVRLLRTRRRQAAPRPADGHEGLPRPRHRQHPQPLYPASRRLRWHVHRRPHRRRRPPRGHRLRHWHPPRRHHHLSVLRDVRQGARRTATRPHLMPKCRPSVSRISFDLQRTPSPSSPCANQPPRSDLAGLASSRPKCAARRRATRVAAFSRVSLFFPSAHTFSFA